MIVTDVQIKTAKTQKHLYCPAFTNEVRTNTYFFQRWFRREEFALIHNREAPSWK